MGESTEAKISIEMVLDFNNVNTFEKAQWALLSFIHLMMCCMCVYIKYVHVCMCVKLSTSRMSLLQTLVEVKLNSVIVALVFKPLVIGFAYDFV